MPIYLLGDTWRRRRLLLAGGVAFVAALVAIAASNGFWLLLAGFTLFGVASGAFVNLAQADLVDHAPARAEQNMARWTFAGSAGVLAGTLAVGATVHVEGSWRWLFGLVAILAATVLFTAFRVPIGRVQRSPESEEAVLATLREGLRWAFQAVRQRRVIGWLTLLELADLVGDTMISYLALYLVDVALATPAEAAIGVAIWTGASLAGDLLVVLLLERMAGLTYLRFNGLATIVLLAAFFAVPLLPVKLALAVPLGLLVGGRFAILEAQLYRSVPGRTASVHALSNLGSMAGNLLPAMLGAAAAAWGLGPALWLVMLGPIAVTIGTWRGEPEKEEEEDA
jgi:FSR family fosmidomycin resistance protein-like MFS transporter